MSLYMVTVSRCGYATLKIEVEATSEKDAEFVALEQAGGCEFCEHTADYDVEAVYTVPGEAS